MKPAFTEFLKTELTKDKDHFQIIKGNDEIKEELRSALITGRHLILIGPPGVGKTTLAKSVANILPSIEVMDCGFNCSPENPQCPICKDKKSKKIQLKERFVRIQGSPDLTVEDLIGDIDPIKALEFGPLSIEAFTPGKIFKANKGILFFDEVNRCPEKLQNSLLQVLEEGKATIGNYAYEFPADFILIATMNPEDSSTEKLSDVFLDRFDAIYVDYPKTKKIEEDIIRMKEDNLEVKFSNKLLSFIVGFIQDLRENPNLEKKPSVRATIGLVERSKSHALLRGRNEVVYEDIRDSIISVLSHRIRLKPSLRYIKSSKEFLQQQFTEFTGKNPDVEDSNESDSP